MIDTLERPRISRKLTPQEFKAQLWIGLTCGAGDLLPRYEIEWRQERIEMMVPPDGETYTHFQVYDRAIGGEELIHGYIEPSVMSVRSNTCTTTISLACNFWPGAEP